MRGPIDYIIVNFSEPKFEGQILEELQKAEASGAIAVLGLSLVMKQLDGSVQQLTVDNESAIFASLEPGDASIIGDDDIEEVGSLLEPEQAAGLLIVEQLWAKGLKKAILDTGGSLVAEGRIHPEAALELESKEA
jgi:hypothetical protein